MSIRARTPVEERLAVSVLAHDAGDTIDEVIAALHRQSVQPASVLVVDNGSRDDTVERCRTHGLRVHAQSNRGVGAGHAVGLEQLFGDERIDYVLLLEHDSITARTCVEHLVTAIAALEAQDLPVGVIACTVVHPAEGAACLARAEAILSPAAVHPARRITFNGLLMSWDAFARVGSPRSDFFVGQEDSDLFRRLRRVGVPIRTASHAVVAHAGKGRHRRGEDVPASRARYSARNTTYRDMYLDRHPLRGSVRLARAILRATVRRDDEPVASLHAVRNGYAGRLGPLEERADQP